MAFLIVLLGIFLTSAYLWSALITTSLGILIMVVSIGYAVGSTKKTPLLIPTCVSVAVILITIMLLPSTEKVSPITEEQPVYVEDDDPSYNYPSAYEEAEEMSRGTCSYAQESSSDNLSCDAGE